MKLCVNLLLIFFVVSNTCTSSIVKEHSKAKSKGKSTKKQKTIKKPKKQKTSKKQKANKLKKPTHIAIIGAGPAGLSFATRIQEAFDGSATVTVFDSRSKVGGQSQTTNITGTPSDKGTRYLVQTPPVSTTYEEVFDLFRQNRVKTYKLPTYNIMKKSSNGSGLSLVLKQPLDDAFLAAYAALAVSLASYQRENPAYNFSGDYSSPFYAANNIGVNNLLDSVVDFQLYGPRKKISAHSLLTWLAGSIYYGSQQKIVSMVKGGWEPAWQKIARNSGSQVVLNSKVLAVNPNLTSGKPEVVFKDGERLVFDAIVVTSPLDELLTPLGLQDAGISHKLTETYVSTIAFGSSSMADEGLPERYHLHDMIDVGCPVSAIQYDGFSSTLNIHIWVASSYEVGKDTTEEESRARVRPWIDKMMLAVDTAYNASETHFIDDYWELYRYNIRFSTEQFAVNLPHQIDSLQGTNDIWYGGGTLSHWNVADILHQSSMIVERMASKYGLQPSWKFVPAMKKKTERKITHALNGSKVNPTISDLTGHYKLDGHTFADTIEIERVDDEDAIISTLPLHAITVTKGAPIVAVGKISLSNMNFIIDPPQISGFSMLDKNKDGYYIALHANGIVRFHSINPSVPVRSLLLVLESKNMTDAGLNSGHSIKYGCFSFGVLQENESGIVTIQIYNRWAEDVDTFYSMEKYLHD